MGTELTIFCIFIYWVIGFCCSSYFSFIFDDKEVFKLKDFIKSDAEFLPLKMIFSFISFPIFSFILILIFFLEFIDRAIKYLKFRLSKIRIRGFSIINWINKIGNIEITRTRIEL